MQFALKFDPERSAAVVGLVFGLATLAAGGTVLLGRDPGYLVYRPLLLFRTTTDVVAVDSVRAMTLRTVVWLVLWGVLAWVWRHKRTAPSATVRF